MANRLFGKLIRAVLSEVVRELAKSDGERRAEDDVKQQKRAARRRRFDEQMARSEQFQRERAEAQRREAQHEQEMIDLLRAAGGDHLPFEPLRDRFATNAIALVRPYPPHRAPAGRSHVGGLPDLPAGTDWPINAEGLPLHFVAQIDLAELPAGSPRPDLLPLRGTMLFFARMDREYFFDEGDPVRILFDESSCGVRAQAPVDLAPVDEDWERGFALDGEVAPNTLPEWPWQLAAIRSIPDTAALEHNAASNPAFAEYDEGLKRLRSSEIERMTGLATVEDGHWPDVGIFAQRTARDAWQLLPAEQTGFPWTARGLALVCRAVGKRMGHHPKMALLADTLKGWREQAEDDAPDQRVSAEEANALILRLNQMMKAEYRDHVYDDGREVKIYGDGVKGAISGAVHRLVMEAGGNPALARALPDELYRNAYPRHAPLVRKNEYQDVRHSQMFGFMPSSQDPLPAQSPLLTLIQFASDPGIAMVIGDMGEINVNITREALAAERWNDIQAWHVGG